MYSQTKVATHSRSRCVGDVDVHRLCKCPIKAHSHEAISQRHADHVGVHLWDSGKVHGLYLEPRCKTALDPRWALPTGVGSGIGTVVAAPATAATAPALGALALDTTVTTVATEPFASAFPV